MKPLECVNCGAPLERDSLQCEYCGTRYAAEGAGENTVNIYADYTVLAKVIKHIDIKQLDLVKDSPYPFAAYPHTSAEKAGKRLERRKQYENI